METNADLAIVRIVLSTIANDPDHPLKAYRHSIADLAGRLQKGDVAAAQEFWGLVRDTGSADSVVASLARTATGFMESEVKRLQDFSSRQPLTNEEKQMASKAIGGLLASLKLLVERGPDGEVEDRER